MKLQAAETPDTRLRRKLGELTIRTCLFGEFQRSLDDVIVEAMTCGPAEGKENRQECLFYLGESLDEICRSGGRAVGR
jgi:hypothetical protein